MKKIIFLFLIFISSIGFSQDSKLVGNSIFDNDYKCQIQCPEGYRFVQLGIINEKYYREIFVNGTFYRKYYMVQEQKTDPRNDTISVTIAFTSDDGFKTYYEKYFKENESSFQYYYNEIINDVEVKYIKYTPYYAIFYKSNISKFRNVCGFISSYETRTSNDKDFFKSLLSIIKVNQKELNVTIPLVTVTGPVIPVEEDTLSPRQTGVKNENGIAVVIGNKNYTSKNVPIVDFALNDALLMKEYLIKTLGYKPDNIIYFEDAKQSDFNSIFGNEKNFRGKLFNYLSSKNSDVFVYYSGHGAPDPESKAGFFVPVDCDPSNVSLNGYSLALFYSNLSKLPSNNITVVLDACFSGGYENGMLLKNISPIYITSDESQFPEINGSILTSAKGDQVSSWYPEKSHSLFTYCFLKGLRGEADNNFDNKITLGEMRTYLEEKVSRIAQRKNGRLQNPQIFGEGSKILVEY